MTSLLCVVCSSHETVFFYSRHAAHPESALILHPREIQVLWSQTYDTGIYVVPGREHATTYISPATPILFILCNIGYRAMLNIKPGNDKSLHSRSITVLIVLTTTNDEHDLSTFQVSILRPVEWKRDSHDDVVVEQQFAEAVNSR